MSVNYVKQTCNAEAIRKNGLKQSQVICLECNQSFSKCGLSKHLHKIHSTNIEAYSKKHFQETCDFCDEPKKYWQSGNFYATCGSKECKAKLRNSKIDWSEALKARDARQKAKYKKIFADRKQERKKLEATFKYQCLYCGRGFETKTKFANHLSRKHDGFHEYYYRHGLAPKCKCGEFRGKDKSSTFAKTCLNPKCYNEQKTKSAQKTCFERYGVVAPACLPEVQAKTKKTFRKNWGEDHPMHNAKFASKNVKYKTKHYTMPSGKKVRIQGYEDRALDILLQSFTEEELITAETAMPKFFYQFKNKKRRYYPDIYIPHLNLVIEVKSPWTVKQDALRNIKKMESVKQAGFNYKMMVMEKNGKLVNPGLNFM